jgi:hypothetical protein
MKTSPTRFDLAGSAGPACALAIFLSLPAVAVPGEITLPALLHEMTERGAVASLPAPGYTLKQSSSHDPRKTDPANADGWHSNNDHDNAMRTEVRIFGGATHDKSRELPLVLGGSESNTMTGTWLVKSGRLTLAKDAGVAAAAGTITVDGQACLAWTNSDQLDDAAAVELLGTQQGGATLNLNGCNEKFATLKLAPHAKILTDDAQGSGGVLTVKSLTVNQVKMPAGTYTAATGKWIDGNGKVVVIP